MSDTHHSVNVFAQAAREITACVDATAPQGDVAPVVHLVLVGVDLSNPDGTTAPLTLPLSDAGLEALAETLYKGMRDFWRTAPVRPRLTLVPTEEGDQP